MIALEVGKSYLLTHKSYTERGRGKDRQTRAQILDVRGVGYGIDDKEVTTNHRPWHEGGTGTLRLSDIVAAVEIPRGPHDR